MKTQVGIIGAGPSGLALAQVLHQHGIETVILESKSYDHVMQRVRAGVLEQGTINTLNEYGAGERMMREGMPVYTAELRYNREFHSVPYHELTGKHMMTYGQQAVVRDLIALRREQGNPLFFSCPVSRIEELDGPLVNIHYTEDGVDKVLECDFVAGCDGYQGVSRNTIPADLQKTFLKEYPFGWLGILAEAAPAKDMLGFVHSDRGFALGSARSPEVSRHYIQVWRDDSVDNWSDDAIWDELDARFADGSGRVMNRGRVIQKNIAWLRSFVCETMRYKRMFLAGDAAHIVPPTGAKGLNLAIGDIRILSQAFVRYYKNGDTQLMDEYAEIALRRIWKTMRFSWWMTTTAHLFPGQTNFDTQMQIATFDYFAKDERGRDYFANGMVGVPFEV